MGYGLIFFVVGAIVARALYKRHRRSRFAKRKQFIEDFVFPETLKRKLLEKYPHLNADQAHTVINGLRDYFQICNIAGGRMVSMPSQAVDVVWHEFILFTLQYKNFCQKALGRFLHHVPAEAMKRPTSAQTGIKRAWKLACMREDISPKSPKYLPLLFAIDANLRIPDGFSYALNCRSLTRGHASVDTSNSSSASFCASDIGCSSGCGSDGDNDSGDGGCGGGCGGD